MEILLNFLHRKYGKETLRKVISFSSQAHSCTIHFPVSFVVVLPCGWILENVMWTEMVLYWVHTTSHIEISSTFYHLPADWRGLVGPTRGLHLPLIWYLKKTKWLMKLLIEKVDWGNEKKRKTMKIVWPFEKREDNFFLICFVILDCEFIISFELIWSNPMCMSQELIRKQNWVIDLLVKLHLLHLRSWLRRVCKSIAFVCDVGPEVTRDRSARKAIRKENYIWSRIEQGQTGIHKVRLESMRTNWNLILSLTISNFNDAGDLQKVHPSP